MWYHIKKIRNKTLALFFLTFVLWDIHFLNYVLTEGALGNISGIIPQEPLTLPALLHWSFFHGSLEHIISNTFGLIVFGGVVLLRDKISTFFILTVLLSISTGFMVWTFGSSGSHIGFSGVLFGFLSYILTRGFFSKDRWSILLAIVIAFFYGSMIVGVLPGKIGISWEAHLFGFINGIVFSYIINHRRKPRFKRQF